MKRFHVHVSVAALDPSVRFYSALFGAEPTVLKSDYAKWQLEDPRVNFAVSTGSVKHGLSHLGIQSESAEEQAAMQAQLERAGLPAHIEQGIGCCYARSDKAWVEDPSGIAWETFHTLGSIAERDAAATANATACCAPQALVRNAAPANTACCP